jgi:excinuclease ABC subunit C
MTTSVLDDIPGLGPTRRKRLVKELGGVNAVRRATLEQLKELSWLPDAVAEAVHAKTHGIAGGGSPASSGTGRGV